MLDTVHSLSSLPATDGNFISVLNRATDEEISQAIDVIAHIFEGLKESEE